MFQHSPVNVLFQLMLNSSDYVLRGVVNHFGTMELGHCQSVVFLNGKQFKISDELVQHNENEAIDQCYLAFYEKQHADDNMPILIPCLLAPSPESTVSSTIQRDKDQGKKTQCGNRKRSFGQGKKPDLLPTVEKEKSKEQEKKAKRSQNYRQRKKGQIQIVENEFDLSSAVFYHQGRRLR